MSRAPSPLVGYNTNVRHKGKLFHIQTEDSGVNHPHVITHLFADGGRIVASRKTGYAEHLGAEDLAVLVKKLMQEQHKQIFIELRDCVYDEPEEGAAAATAAPTPEPEPAPEVDVDALERAANARWAESVAARAPSGLPRRGSGRYQQTVPAGPGSVLEDSIPPESIFGGDPLSGKSLDEVILSYLADEGTGTRK
jgi:hypothetical protein